MDKMKWENLLCTHRLEEEEPITHRSDARSPFESDVGRITFSGAFRRLGRKTQVHPLAANDNVHTRLTHSFEVAQVGKALGKRVALKIKNELPENVSPSDIGTILEAACLAHDIGNPPFGHAGEEAMDHWFEVNQNLYSFNLTDEEKRDISHFEGNAQGFRLLTQTENHIFKGGLRLTFATLGTFLKYPWTSEAVREGKYGAYLSEKEIIERISTKLGLPRKGEHKWARHPLAYLVEAADDICYAIIDLEDAVEMGIMKFKDVMDIISPIFTPKELESIKQDLEPDERFRVNLARLRGPVFDKLTTSAVDGFLASYDPIMKGEDVDNVFSALGEEDNANILVQKAKKVAKQEIFDDPRKVEIELGSYSIFDSLLTPFCSSAIEVAKHLEHNKNKKLTWKSQLVIKLLGDHSPLTGDPPKEKSWNDYQCLRRAVDYVSGMTDNYAVYIAKQLQGEGFSGFQRH